MKKKNIGVNPKTLPAIKYCKKHNHFINLHPDCHSDILGRFRVVCPDCGIFGEWMSGLKEAIEYWNNKYGISA